MKGKKLYLGIAGVVGFLVLYIFWNSFTQPGVHDLRSGFKRVAFYKNENNTGPVERVYVATLRDTLWDEMKIYGDYMPHTKYGNTKVYFFKDTSPVPDQLEPGKENFAQQYRKYCLAKYEKDAMGQVSFIKDPYQ